MNKVEVTMDDLDENECQNRLEESRIRLEEARIRLEESRIRLEEARNDLVEKIRKKNRRTEERVGWTKYFGFRKKTI